MVVHVASTDGTRGGTRCQFRWHSWRYTLPMNGLGVLQSFPTCNLTHAGSASATILQPMCVHACVRVCC